VRTCRNEHERASKRGFLGGDLLAWSPIKKATGLPLTIFLFNNDHVNSSTQRGWVDRVPRLGDGTADTPNVLHGTGRLEWLGWPRARLR
jgi:hypothetical protein